jgi:hypothetical protein
MNMSDKKANRDLKISDIRTTRGINIPPQKTVPKMPPVQPPKKSK